MRIVRQHIIICLLLLGFAACHKAPKQTEETPLFRLLESNQTGLDFSNDLPVDLDLNIFNYMYYYNGGGLATADFNQDGLMDVYLTSNLGEDKMFLNRGGLKFEDISDKTQVDAGPDGWTTGASVADINDDGLLDIYISQVGNYRKLDAENRLLMCTGIDESGIPQYREAAAEYGLDFKGFSTQAGFFDYDLDGDLDMFLMNHSLHHNGTFGQRKTFVNTVHPESGDKLFRNDQGKFTDVTVEAGIQSSVIGYGLGLAFGDVNLDGYPDIYIGNDFHENDYLYINQQDGTFSEEIADQMRHTSRFTMGVDIADINNDIYPDIISLDMLPEDPEILKRSEGEDALNIFNFKLNYGYNHQYARNSLQLNNGNNTFSDVAMYAKVFATDWSWSPLIFDMDMDGQKDLFISNGIPKRMNDIDYIDFVSGDPLQKKIQFDDLQQDDMAAVDKIPEIKLKNKLYLQDDSSLTFKDLEAMVVNNKVSYSNSAVYADFDNDGDLDVLTNNINESPFLYENIIHAERGRTMKVKLEGPANNRNAIGARIFATTGDETQYFENYQVKAFQSSMVGPLHIGKEAGEAVDLKVVWPDHTVSELKGVTDNEITVSWEEGLAGFDYQSLKKKGTYALQSSEEALKVDFVHEENPFVEFNREVLIPHEVSSEGPAIAVGDLNGDGKDDLFVGGAKRRHNALFFQTESGKFEKIQSPALQQDSIYEDVKAEILDIDNDGDNDLLIATGGNEYREGNEYTRPLLYLNDGKGNLTKKEDAFEGVSVVGSALVCFDMTGDGFTDVYIGARAKTWNYGDTPISYVLKNDGTGKFSVATDEIAPGLKEAGLIKDATKVDLDQDGDMDILVALEWGGIKWFENNGNTFAARDITDKKGFWNFVLPFDADNDGDLDILAGNQGLNHRFSVSESQPLRMYYNDFDDNGTKEQILTYYLKGKEIPFHNKKELEKQLPFIKKKYVYAKDFAKAGFREIFPSNKLRNYLEVNFLHSVVLINEGKGDFSVKKLPEQVQWTPFMDAYVFDGNGDELEELLMVGNFHNANIQMGRYDCDYGTLLNNEGGGNFDVAELGGDPLKGQIKGVEPIQIGEETYLVMARNDEGLKIMKLTRP